MGSIPPRARQQRQLADAGGSPTLVAHGAADERVHPEQSQELYQTLGILGVPTGLVVYPREPHGLRERAHQLDFMHRVIEWLDQYVKNASPTTD
jgi:dipeptidyl aminopeptidase/acylaminoacyl peptidase